MLSSFPSLQGRVAGRHLDPIKRALVTRKWSIRIDWLQMRTLSTYIPRFFPSERNSEAWPPHLHGSLLFPISFSLADHHSQQRRRVARRQLFSPPLVSRTHRRLLYFIVALLHRSSWTVMRCLCIVSLRFPVNITWLK